MFSKDDPRASLATPQTAAPSTFKSFAAAEYQKFYEAAPHDRDSCGCTWYARGQNFLVAYTQASMGGVFNRSQQPDEYVVALPDREMSVIIQWEEHSVRLPGNSIAFVPAGASKVTAQGSGRFFRLFTTVSRDLADSCGNAASYAQPHPNIPAFAPWPDPVDGPRIRTYGLDVPAEAGRFGRLFRGSTLMVNFLEPRIGARDPSNMSPHHHDDFEHGSLALDGEFLHCIRWPWTTDMREWRADDMERCASPSLCVIPPPAIHTSQALSAGLNQLVDIFCPPRMDFSLKEGWVLNAADYPMPSSPNV